MFQIDRWRTEWDYKKCHIPMHSEWRTVKFDRRRSRESHWRLANQIGHRTAGGRNDGLTTRREVRNG